MKTSEETIEELKGKSEVINDSLWYMNPHDILTTLTTRDAEIVKMVEGMKHLEENDDYDGGYNHAIDDIIKALTSSNNK